MIHRFRTLPLIPCTSFLLLSLCLTAHSQGRHLTLEQASGRGERLSFSGSPPRIRWAADGKHLVRGRGEERVWLDPLTGEEEPAPERRETRTAAAGLREAFLELEGFDEERAGKAARTRKSFAEDGKALLLQFEVDLYFRREGGAVRRLTGDSEDDAGGARRLEVQLAPGARAASFVQEHNLSIIDTESGVVRPLSRDGSENLLYGRLDWVYQEELYGRGNWRGAWWSPDGRFLAFLRLDESEVPRYTILDHRSYHPKRDTTAYPKAGDPNPTATLGVARARDGRVVWLDLSAYPEEFLIVRVGWSPDGERLIFQVQDRIQTWLDLNAGDPDTGEVTRLLRETSDSWVNILGTPRWLEDGGFLWLSERSGWRHIYRYRPDGKLVGSVTRGEWEVRRILRIDEERGDVWFTGSRDGAIEGHAYRVSLAGGDGIAVTTEAGSHSITLNDDASLFLDRFSSVSTPPVLRLCDRDGKLIRELGRAEIPALDEYAHSAAEILEIPARDGFIMDAMLIKPPDFDPARRYPVWLPTYSGPNAPSVRNRWRGDAWEQFLAQQGHLIFRVNNRSSSGRGQWSTARCYKELGVSELRDLEDAVAWLCRNPWADATRVGISGWSYGGFMSAYALTHSKAFRLGVAGAGVYDWRDYDTIYTERYMSTPGLNPEGYQRSSCVEAAGDLSGHLVIVHGTLDDNVHVQNAMQFIHALQRAGRSFELMLYPGARHGIRDREQRWHLRRLTWNAIQEHLGSPGEPAATMTASPPREESL